MNIVKERKRLETIKPTFTCRRCGHSWCAGYDGVTLAQRILRGEESNG